MLVTWVAKVKSLLLNNKLVIVSLIICEKTFSYEGTHLFPRAMTLEQFFKHCG